MTRARSMRRCFGMLLLAAAVLPARGEALITKLRPETVRAFDEMVQRIEPDLERRARTGAEFAVVEVDRGARQRARRGEIVIVKLPTPKVKIPHGKAHYWGGIFFDLGRSAEDYLRILLDYKRHQDYYADVLRSELVSKDGDRYHSRLRLYKKKVLSATLNADFETLVTRPKPGTIYLKSVATRIAEVAEPGTPEEHERPVGEDSGFLWRQNSYWRLVDADGGVYVQLVTLSLSRDIPTGLGWIVGPFVNSVPEETLRSMLATTRKVGRKRAAAKRRGAADKL